jgi:hypothetical protein
MSFLLTTLGSNGAKSILLALVCNACRLCNFVPLTHLGYACFTELLNGITQALLQESEMMARGKQQEKQYSQFH